MYRDGREPGLQCLDGVVVLGQSNEGTKVLDLDDAQHSRYKQIPAQSDTRATNSFTYDEGGRERATTNVQIRNLNRCQGARTLNRSAGPFVLLVKPSWLLPLMTTILET